MFEDSDLSVGEIIRTITQEKFTGLKSSNKGVLTNMSDQEWYESIQKANEYEQE
tara:strand:- start:612 stop:773 length:162 start_codon:yes stop_codon:yes gene_type:complete